MLIIGHRDVSAVLNGKELDIVDVVRDAYRRHDAGQTSVPHSTFLRFPGDDRNRIIGLPAYLGDDEPVAGMKWISSFPGNVAHGGQRANAAILLNSTVDGRPHTLIEGSVISAKRTAASAALAASVLAGADDPDGVTLIGCGVINFEVARFLTAVLPGITTFTLFDQDPARAKAFAARVAEHRPEADVRTTETADAALAAHRLVAIATTAATPHLDVTPCRPGTVLLHISLRDLPAETILTSQNVVDDADHVSRERTSVHLAEQRVGHRGFIDTTIGQLLTDTSALTRDPHRLLVFSPFGLGVLDLAVARYARTAAVRDDLGVNVGDFLP